MNIKKHRYRCVSLLGVAAMCILVPQGAKAGINSNEAHVISAAKSTFEYDGETYIARQFYVDQLVSYLDKDSTNLTSEEADAAVNKIYSNIETGVKSGYIVKVTSDKNDQNTDEEYEINEVSPEEKDAGITDISQIPNKDNSTKEDTEAITNPGTIQKDNSGRVTATDNTGEKVAVFDGILTDTGASMKKSIITAIIAGIVLLITLAAALKYKTFARKYASRS